MQIVNLETDKDVIGFEGLSDIETQQFLKYDESWIISAPSPHMYEFQYLTPICEVTIQLSAKVLTQRRKNTKLIEVLGDVGGLMEVVWSMLNIIATGITEILYDKALINNLFSFNLDKKMVEIKKKKDSPNSSNTMELDAPKIYEPMENINKNLNNIQNELSPQLRNKLNEDIFKTKEKPFIIKRKKKKKIKSINTLDFPNSQNINFNIKTTENDNLKGIDMNNIFNKDKNTNSGNIENMMKFEVKIVDHKTDKGYENKRIVNKIKMKCYCVYFWFCFARKKRIFKIY